jgi:hypothetical protein
MGERESWRVEVVACRRTSVGGDSAFVERREKLAGEESLAERIYSTLVKWPEFLFLSQVSNCIFQARFHETRPKGLDFYGDDRCHVLTTTNMITKGLHRVSCFEGMVL